MLMDAMTVNLNPSLVDYMIMATTRVRWDEGNFLPQCQVRFIPSYSP
jgi:hypothetical protein